MDCVIKPITNFEIVDFLKIFENYTIKTKIDVFWFTYQYVTFAPMLCYMIYKLMFDEKESKFEKNASKFRNTDLIFKVFSAGTLIYYFIDTVWSLFNLNICTLAMIIHHIITSIGVINVLRLPLVPVDMTYSILMHPLIMFWRNKWLKYIYGSLNYIALGLLGCSHYWHRLYYRAIMLVGWALTLPFVWMLLSGCTSPSVFNNCTS